MPLANVEQLLERGQALHRDGRLPEAEGALRDALKAAPDHPKVLHALAAIELASECLVPALQTITRALAMDPRNAEAFHTAGRIHRRLGDFQKASDAFVRAVTLRRDLLAVYRDAADMACGAAAVAQQAGRDKTAREFRQGAARWLSELGVVLAEKELRDAEGVYREAAALDPRNPAIANNLGVFLRDLGRPAEAEMQLRRALMLTPGYADAYMNLGNALAEQGRSTEAEAAYRKGISLDPRLTEHMSKRRSGLLAELHYRADVDSAQLCDAHRHWGDEIVAGRDARASVFANDPDPERRLRIGYVSPDFREHSVAYFFEPLLAGHDAATFDVTCYSGVKRPDRVTARLERMAACWQTTVGIGDAELSALIRRDKIDILVDLAGHFSGNRLPVFAMRPAPIAVTWLGYPGTTGLTTIDYRITDELADPAGAERFHTERLIRLPQGFLCYRPPAHAPPVAPAPCLRERRVAFGSFNNLPKLSDGTVAAWARVLAAVPGSRLLLKAKTLSDTTIRQRCRERFERAGVAGDRLDIRGWINEGGDHLALYNEIDIALDPFPYNGTTTTLEALWMGVPVIALAGARHSGRVGFSILMRVGLADLVAPTIDDYVERAATLASDHAAIDRLRQSMRARLEASPLLDAPGFVRSFEEALRTIWQQWCARAQDPAAS
jgi:protein O-GlcNAc transferase